MFETSEDRSVDFGMEMILQVGHASVADKRWDGTT
jgi:hypothetical protein